MQVPFISAQKNKCPVYSLTHSISWSLGDSKIVVDIATQTDLFLNAIDECDHLSGGSFDFADCSIMC